MKVRNSVKKAAAAASSSSSPQQRTLLAFFSSSSTNNDNAAMMKTPPPPTKRKTTEEEEEENSEPMKRFKTSGGDNVLVGGNDDDDEKKTEAAATPPSTATTPPPLTPEQRSLVMEKQTAARLRLVASRFPVVDATSVGHSWFNAVLDQEFKKPYFKQLSDFYCGVRATVFPKKENIFSWTRFTPIRDVKVVIIGQDPYHGPNQAHGLCFSVQKGVQSPPSLVNMFKELVNDPEVPEFQRVPTHGCLVGWAEQGVLLLNAVLTVEQSRAHSHKDRGWEHLTTSVIKWISSNLRDCVFLLWGSHAQKMAGGVVDKTRHSVLSTVHPSPLSAHRGFLGCRHFSRCNEILTEKGKTPIRWEHLP